MPNRTLDIAYCYPYGMEELEALVEETDGYWRMDTIGVSQAARDERNSGVMTLPFQRYAAGASMIRETWRM